MLGEAHATPFLALGTDPIDDLIALIPELDKLWQKLWRILQAGQKKQEDSIARTAHQALYVFRIGPKLPALRI
ncbi:hypothetical protein [Bradyrhizobium retamae]|uniref:hypothetical protein n=1 Tax=Bradyrhizobium retamae TaxID=1300035 RepID=UPI000AAB2AEC|nr:hypothetical protein [Bradyrhizobium retamae]